MRVKLDLALGSLGLVVRGSLGTERGVATSCGCVGTSRVRSSEDREAAHQGVVD